MEPVGLAKSIHEFLSCPSRQDCNMNYIKRIEYIIQANKMITIQNFLYTFIPLQRQGCSALYFVNYLP